MSDNRDFSKSQKPHPSTIRDPRDPDLTPIEGTPIALSLRGEVIALREDLRAHTIVDAHGLEAIRAKQETQSQHITDIRIETAKQTVMLENLGAEHRKKTEAEEARKKTRHERWFEIGKWALGLAGGLVLGYLSHRLHIVG